MKYKKIIINQNNMKKIRIFAGLSTKPVSNFQTKNLNTCGGQPIFWTKNMPTPNKKIPNKIIINFFISSSSYLTWV
jgi:hypothetical protein